MEHWQALKRILRYIKGTIGYKIKYSKSGKNITSHSDADWVGDLYNMKSTSSYIFILGEGTISWGSKKQTRVALSSIEAEYIALFQATKEAIRFQKLMSETLQEPKALIYIRAYNQSCMALASTLR